MSARSRLIVQKALEQYTSTNQPGSDNNGENSKPNLKNVDVAECSEEGLESEQQNDLLKFRAGPSTSDLNHENQVDFSNLINDSDADSEYISEDDPFAASDADDEYVPSCVDSSDTEEDDGGQAKKVKRTDTQLETTDVVVEVIPNPSNEINLIEENTKHEKQKKKKIFKNTEKITRKRLRNPNMWTRNIAAIARNNGKAYINQKGKEMQAKVVNLGALCNETCKKRCSDQFNADQRKEILSSYYSLDIDMKNLLLFKNISCRIPKRHRKDAAHHRSATFTYTVTINNTAVVVCKHAFCSLYQIGKKKVEYHQQRIKKGLHAPEGDRRGKHDNRPHKLADEVKNYVVEHIKLFPVMQSHYSRNKNPHKQYLSSVLNISKMYDLYREQCLEEKKPLQFQIKYCSYSRIFSTEFNYSFGDPRSDTCSTCDSGNCGEEHKENYEAAFSLQRTDREYAKGNDGVCYLTVDLQQTLPLPRLSTSKAFYLRQMWMYNLGIHSITKGSEQANFFTWTEDVARRGSSEVCSSLLTMLEYNPIFQDNAISHLIVWTDSCAGQNKNFLMICLYQYLILKGIVKTIDHKFPEVGHSYLDSDRDFGRIEKVLRRHENIYLPDDYRRIISQSSKMNHVTDMSPNFRQFEDLAGKLNLINRKKNTINENVPFRDGIKWIRVTSFGSYLYKESFDQYTPFKEVNIIRNARIPTPEKVELQRIATKTGELSVEKIANLKTQLQFVKEPFQWYYNMVIEEQENKV